MKIILSIFFLLIFNLSFSNTIDDNSVTITTIGNGATFEKARESALFSAITQVCGVYLSQDLKISNDEVVKEEITSITKGNIEKYTILSEVKIDNGECISTLKVIVSVTKLKSYVESKGYKVEFNGAAFAMNMKLKILNERAEVQCVKSLYNNLLEPLQLAYDYEIKTLEPVSVNNNNNNWKVTSNVLIVANKNMDICATLHNNTLKAIGLDASEIESYKSLNKKIYKYAVMYGDKIIEFSFRNSKTIDLLKAIDYIKYKFRNNFLIVRNNSIIILHDDLHQSYGDKFKNFPYSNSLDKNYSYNFHEEFYTSKFYEAGKFIDKYAFSENFSLKEIENLKEYSVKSNGIAIKFKQGGYALDNNSGHGIAITMIDFPDENWKKAIQFCENLNYGDYNDWRLPTFKELEIIRKKVGDIINPGSNFNYWSSTSLKGFTETNEYGTQQNLSNYAMGCCGFVVEYPQLSELYDKNVKLKSEKMKFIAVRNY